MAVVDAKYCTVIGTPDQIQKVLGLLNEAGTVDMKFANVVVLNEPVTREQLKEALETTPRIQT